MPMPATSCSADLDMADTPAVRCTKMIRIAALAVAVVLFCCSAQAQDRATVLFLFDISKSYAPVGDGRSAPLDTAMEAVLRDLNSVADVAFAVIGNCECKCRCRQSHGTPERPCTPDDTVFGASSAPGDWNDAEDGAHMRAGLYRVFDDRIAQWKRSSGRLSVATDIGGGLCKATDIFAGSHARRRYLVLLSDLHDSPADTCAKLAYLKGGLRNVTTFAYRQFSRRGVVMDVQDRDTRNVDIQLRKFGAGPVILVDSGEEIADEINRGDPFPP